LFSRRTLSSGNTLGAQYRSDGQMKARMLPQTPPLVVCPHCQTLFCMAGAEHAIEYRNYFPGWGFMGEPTPEALASKKAQEALVEQYRDVPGYELATVVQCLQYVQSEKMVDNEKQLRLYAWHRVNDERMESCARELAADECTNLRKLLHLLPHESDPEILLRAEALRELGCFDEAAQSLDHDFSDDFAARAEQIMQAIERHDDQPFVFETTHNDGDIHFEWAWQARRMKTQTLELPDQPMVPPLFHIGNRDWWVKVLGMMSHNWALIEPQANGQAMVYFFHDKGMTLRPSGFKRADFSNRSAVVDALQFDDVAQAQRALKANDFDRLKVKPGPWLDFVPEGHFWDARETEEGIYSNKGYWKTAS
jgi:hypothetical protein